MSTPSVNPSARVQVLPAPVAAPGQCGMCGRAESDNGFVDIKMDFEFYGVLYFCGYCAMDIGASVGLLRPEDLSSMRDTLAAQEQELITLREAVLGLETEVDGLLSHRDRILNRNDRINNASTISPVPNPDPWVDPLPARPDEPSGPPEQPADAGAPPVRAPAEPVNVSGPDDVRNANATVDAILGDTKP